MRHVDTAALSILLIFGGSLGARAQDVGGAIDMTGMGIYGMEDAVTQAAGGSPKASVGRAGTTVRRATPNALLYTPSAARRKRNYATFLARTRARDPKAAASLQALLAKTDVVASAQRRAAELGFRPNSASDAFALYWVVTDGAAHGREAPESPKALAAVRTQAARAFGAAPGASRASDAAKQQLAEACLVQAALIDGMFDAAKGKPDAMRRLGAAVRQGARGMGLDLDAYRLTEKGFVPAAR